MNVTFLCGNKTSVLYSCVVPESSITDLSRMYPFSFNAGKQKVTGVYGSGIQKSCLQMTSISSTSFGV